MSNGDLLSFLRKAKPASLAPEADSFTEMPGTNHYVQRDNPIYLSQAEVGPDRLRRNWHVSLLSLTPPPASSASQIETPSWRKCFRV